MVLFDLLQLAGVFLYYLRIEYLWHALIMPLTNRNGMREATTQRKVDYFHLPRPLWRKLKKCLPKQTKMTRRGGRPRASDRAVVNAIWYVLWTGCQWKALHKEWFWVSS